MSLMTPKILFFVLQTSCDAREMTTPIVFITSITYIHAFIVFVKASWRQYNADVDLNPISLCNIKRIAGKGVKTLA